jgi:hypothetical protein
MWLLVIGAVVAAAVCIAAFVRGASALDADARGLFDRQTERREADRRDAA